MLILLTNLIAMAMFYRVDIPKLLNIISTASLFIILFILPLPIYYYILYGPLPPEIFLNPRYGVIYIFIRSILAVSYLSLIPFITGINGLISTLSALNVDIDIIIFFLSIFRAIPNLFREIIKLFLGRASRRVEENQGFISIWKNMSNAVGEFLVRGYSSGYLVSLSFRSRIVKAYNVISTLSIRNSLIYLLYIYSITLITIYFMVMPV
jgi:hypothetical protein